MGNTIAQIKLTGTTGVPIDELKKKMILQEFEEATLLLKNICGLEIVFEVEDIELICVDDL